MTYLGRGGKNPPYLRLASLVNSFIELAVLHPARMALIFVVVLLALIVMGLLLLPS